MKVKVAGILLAAGQSSRFGGHKLVQRLPSTGLTVFEHAASALLAALPDSVAVVRENDHALIELVDSLNMPWVANPNAASGMASSMQRGMAYQLTKFPALGAWLFALADMPYIQPSTFIRVAQALKQGASIAAAEFSGQRGHPVGFSRYHQQALFGIDGDQGAKELLKTHAHVLQRIVVDDESVLRDIDYPEALVFP